MWGEYTHISRSLILPSEDFRDHYKLFTTSTEAQPIFQHPAIYLAVCFFISMRDCEYEYFARACFYKYALGLGHRRTACDDIVYKYNVSIF